MARNTEPKVDIEMRNQNPAAAEVRTITVDTAIGSLTTYAWTLLGIAQSVASASADKAVIAGLIASEIVNDPLTGGLVAAVDDDVDTVTITYRVPGVAFTLTESDANLSIALVTAADAADPILFGLAVIHDADDVSDFHRARVAAAAGLTAMAYDLTPVAVNDATYFVSIKWNGVTYTRHYLADASATVDEIVDGLVAFINTAMPANSVIASEDTATATKMILTSEIAGMPFEVDAWSDADTGLWTIARSDSGGVFADVNKVFAGVAMEDQRIGGDVGTTRLSYPGESAMNVRRIGLADVLAEDDEPDIGDEVWVGTGSGFEGTFRTTLSGGDYVKVDRLEWRGHAGTYAGKAVGVLGLRAA
jgi:hypothetical protein